MALHGRQRHIGRNADVDEPRHAPRRREAADARHAVRTLTIAHAANQFGAHEQGAKALADPAQRIERARQNDTVAVDHRDDGTRRQPAGRNHQRLQQLKARRSRYHTDDTALASHGNGENGGLLTVRTGNHRCFDRQVGTSESQLEKRPPGDVQLDRAQLRLGSAGQRTARIPHSDIVDLRRPARRQRLQQRIVGGTGFDLRRYHLRQHAKELRDVSDVVIESRRCQARESEHLLTNVLALQLGLKPCRNAEEDRERNRDGEHEQEQPPIDRETFIQAAAEANQHPPSLRQFIYAFRLAKIRRTHASSCPGCYVPDQ